MRELKIVLLVLTVGFGSSVPATTKFPTSYYSNTIKGGLQITQKTPSAKTAVVELEGEYDYYLQYIKFMLNYKKSEEEKASKKSVKSPSCVLNYTSKNC